MQKDEKLAITKEKLMDATFQKQYLSFLDNNEVKKITESDLPPRNCSRRSTSWWRGVSRKTTISPGR